MAIDKQKQAENFFERLKGAHKQLSDKFAPKEQLDHLGALINQYGENIGGGDNSQWREFYPSYQVSKGETNLLKQFPPKINGIGVFAQNLGMIVTMAWYLQLMSPPASDAILKEIWELAGEIASGFDVQVKFD